MSVGPEQFETGYSVAQEPYDLQFEDAPTEMLDSEALMMQLETTILETQARIAWVKQRLHDAFGEFDVEFKAQNTLACYPLMDEMKALEELQAELEFKVDGIRRSIAKFVADAYRDMIEVVGIEA